MPLTFLEDGVTYVAQSYRDTKQTDCGTTPYAMTIENKVVTKGDALKVRLTAAGRSL